MTSQSPRPEIIIQGTSRNPEYNISSNNPRFVRAPNGKRVAPVSQLNTYAGRVLAREQTSKVASFSEGVNSTHSDITQALSTKHASGTQNPKPRPDGRSVSGTSLPQQPGGNAPVEVSRSLSDRDRLTSQRPRTELSQLLGMTRGSSRKGTTLHDKPPTPAEAPQTTCPECAQPIDPTTNLTPPRGQYPSTPNTIICTTCKCFLPTPPSRITALQPRHPSTKPHTPPPPPSKTPLPPICPTCIPIPGYLASEFATYFPRCPVCGHMTHELLTELMANGGQAAGLAEVVDVQDKRIWGASKELWDWCFWVAGERGVRVGRGGVALEGGLRRAGAVRRVRYVDEDEDGDEGGEDGGEGVGGGGSMLRRLRRFRI